MFKARLQLSLAENVFCQGMVVLLNQVCILLSEMLHVYKSEVRVAVFSEDVRTSKTLASIDPRRLKIVELFGPVFLKLREARRNEAFHTSTDFTLLHVLSRNPK